MFKASIEGSVLEVCEGCLSYGKKIEEPVIIITTKPKPRYMEIPEEIEEKEEFFVDNYGKIVENARKKRGLTREKFAKKINEKDSVIRRIEMEEMTPDDKLTKKLENFLGIRLKESYEKMNKKEIIKKKELTIGDVIEV